MTKNSQQKTNIIWDLSGTLFKPMSWGLSHQELTDLSLVFYMWSGKREASKLDLYALSLLNQAEEPLPEYQVIRLHTGDPVPAVVCSLLAGLLTSQEAYNKVMKAAEQAPKESLSSEELEQAYRMIEAFFDPESLSRCMEPIALSQDVIVQCAQNPHNTFYVLSNWDKESFERFYITRSGQNGLRYFKRENILISADAGYIKPQPEIYEQFLAHYKLDPFTCFFIDDQPENIAAAALFGIEGAQFHSNDASHLIQTFRDLFIIK